MTTNTPSGGEAPERPAIQPGGGSTPPAPADAAAEESAPPATGPPVAGISASAGGLDAFKRFFAAMPADSGIAFVLVPHLSPAHASLMAELIAPHTPIPVAEAADGTAVEANRVSIIPPGKYMTISGGVLRLTGPIERGGPQTSIDLFLRSLAADKQERAIGVILSGTGAHGALGLRAIKAAGGLAVVQDPATAEYPDMPRNAIATGVADYVLPVGQMPAALVEYVQRSPGVGRGRAESAEGADEAGDVGELLAIIRDQTGIDFRDYHTKMLARRIGRRMSLNRLDRRADYLALLRDRPEEVAQLSRDLLVSVTSFFRDPEAWDVLEAQGIARVIQAKQADAPVRAWSAGCATGEEAYSLGILILEQFARARKHCPVQIFATDVDDAALATARRAVYPEGISADIPPERLARFFTPVSDSAHQVGAQLREAVTVARQNLLSDAPFSRLDLVLCRNLLIYLEPDVQKRLLALLHFSLTEGGVLFLGPAETVGGSTDLFEPISAKWRIYRRIGPARAEHLQFPATHWSPRQAGPPSPAKPQTPAKLAGEEPASLAGELQSANSELQAAHEELHSLNEELSAANDQLLETVRELEGANNDITNLFNCTEIATVSLDRDLRVRWFTPAAARLFRFIAADAGRPLPDIAWQFTDDSLLPDARQAMNDLGPREKELLAGDGRWYARRVAPYRTRDNRVDGVVATFVDVTQGKQAADAIRASEGLQRAILSSLTAHIAVTDAAGRIIAVNPAWEAFARANGGDPDRCGVGANYLDACRSVTGLEAEQAQRVADALQAILNGTSESFSLEYPCRPAAQQRWFILHATPLPGGGVVASHTDITDRVRAEDELREREARLSAVLNTAADAIITIDRSGIIQSVNPATERLFGYSRGEMVGQNVKMLMPPPYRGEHDRYLARYHRTGEKRVIGSGREVEAQRKDGITFQVGLAVSEIESLGLFTGILRDISQHKQLEREVVEISSLEQRRIGQDLHDTVAQELTALNILAKDLAETLRTDPAGGAKLAERIAQGLQRSQRELRSILRGLVPVAIETEGLMAALADLADRTRQSGSVNCAFDCPEPVTVADNLVATHLYLIAQEAVHNAVKHARPGNIRVSLESDHRLILRVLDDGIGIPATPTEFQGLGLRIMRNRALIINAVLTVEPVKPSGTLVTCTLSRGSDGQK